MSSSSSSRSGEHPEDRQEETTPRERHPEVATARQTVVATLAAAVADVYAGFTTAGTSAPEPCGVPDPDRDGSAADPDAQMTAEQLRTFASVVRTAVHAARPRPRSAHYASFSETFRACARDAVTGGVNPEAVDVDRFADALRAAENGRRLDSPCFRPPDE